MSARLKTLLLTASACALLGSPAFAQDDAPVETASDQAPVVNPNEDPRDRRIRELTERLDRLEAQLEDLKERTSADTQDLRQTAAAAPQINLANARPTLSTADGSTRFAVRGLIQFDAAHYEERSGNPTDLASGTNFRRARLGVEGTFLRNWNYALTGEFGGSGGEAAILNQAWVEYAGWKPFASGPNVRLRIGAWASPTNLEDGTNNAEGLFLERPAAAELARSIAGGDGRSGVGAFVNGERWYAHAVLTGTVPGTANPAEFDEQGGYLLRFALLPIRGTNYALHIGANVTGVITPADTAAGPARAQALRLRERPELRVDGTRLVDTGSLPADGMVQYGAEIGGYWRNVYGSAEYFRYNINRQGAAPDADFSGWYVQGAWTVTGETRQWVANTGGFRGVRPDHPFGAPGGGWGAWEVAARYSVLNLDDNAGNPGFATPVFGIRGGEQRITTIGLNWYPNNVVRFLLDYQWIDIDRLNGAGAQVGEDAQAISLRSQVNF